jgi:osmotically-inducible protein OsmY
LRAPLLKKASNLTEVIPLRRILHFTLIFTLSLGYAFAQSAEEIQAAAQKTLRAYSLTTIQVSVQNRFVTLTGVVNLYRDRLLADETVSRIHGVETIQDGIKVGGPQVPDAQLKAEIDKIIADRIRALGTFGFGTMKAQVRDGAVTLSGSAAPQLTEPAIIAIDGTVGVRNVINLVHLVSPFDKEPWRSFVPPYLGW